ncbi:DUF1800 domain-containing protein [Ideonella sp. 4Y11]|uniref:DUF1800 domain-containing protein n=1 Tax=Ideonella aquatica TaxID=2824119 RepID=A0A941BJ96_9BURK|nr:DUF1800 domain-containing protein [Ideonella aquatica]MBQ0959337.1 DUF1800 domain-containing protein [Ideonella aquatica]
MSVLRRRLLLTAPALALAGCADLARTPPSAADTNPSRVRRWLVRLAWGADADTLAQVRQTGLSAWVSQQLQPTTTAAPLPAALQARLAEQTTARSDLSTLVWQMQAQRKEAVGLADPQAREKAFKAWQQAMAQLQQEAAARHLWRAVHSPRPLQSRLGWFWLNHFNVFQGKQDLRAMVADYDEQLQAQALGRFRDLLGVALMHPAMLRYLDNDQNAAGRLNENLGRELLELHTLGVDGGYTQADVLAAARALTGLGVAQPPEPRGPSVQRRGLMAFNPARHDNAPKVLLGEPLPGQGLAQVEAMLDRLARHPATARHITRRLALYLLGQPPSPALHQQLAQRFLDSDGRIAEVLRTLLAHPEFEASLGQGFKDPVHWVVSALREQRPPGAGLQPDLPVSWMARLGEAPYQRGTPDGYPLERTAWAAPGQLALRFELARSMALRWPTVWGQAADTPLPADGADGSTSASTREVLASARRPAERLALWWSSPEFMSH